MRIDRRRRAEHTAAAVAGKDALAEGITGEQLEVFGHEESALGGPRRRRGFDELARHLKLPIAVERQPHEFD